MPLNNFARKIEALESFDILSNVIDIINQNSFYVTALLRLQLQEGRDANDEPVRIFGRDFYSDRTIFDKEHGNYAPLGKVTEWITNYKTGDFYSSLETEAFGTVFRTQSDVPYFDEILRRSGDIIIKLNRAHLIELRNEVIIPELRKRIKIALSV